MSTRPRLRSAVVIPPGGTFNLDLGPSTPRSTPPPAPPNTPTTPKDPSIPPVPLRVYGPEDLWLVEVNPLHPELDPGQEQPQDKGHGHQGHGHQGQESSSSEEEWVDVTRGYWDEWYDLDFYDPTSPAVKHYREFCHRSDTLAALRQQLQSMREGSNSSSASSVWSRRGGGHGGHESSERDEEEKEKRSRRRRRLNYILDHQWGGLARARREKDRIRKRRRRELIIKIRALERGEPLEEDEEEEKDEEAPPPSTNSVSRRRRRARRERDLREELDDECGRMRRGTKRHLPDLREEINRTRPVLEIPGYHPIKETRSLERGDPRPRSEDSLWSADKGADEWRRRREEQEDEEEEERRGMRAHMEEWLRKGERSPSPLRRGEQPPTVSNIQVEAMEVEAMEEMDVEEVEKAKKKKKEEEEVEVEGVVREDEEEKEKMDVVEGEEEEGMKRSAERETRDMGTPLKRARNLGHELRIVIPSRNAGSIIGKGGSNISRLRSENKATISVPDCPGPERLITIAADDQDISFNVLSEIVPLLEDAGVKSGSSRDGRDGGGSSRGSRDGGGGGGSDSGAGGGGGGGGSVTGAAAVAEVRLLLHHSQVGCVIGKGGGKIKELREASGAQIKVYGSCCPRSTDRVVAVSGASDVVVSAIKQIVALAADSPIKGMSEQYDPHNYDEVYASQYGGFGEGRGSSRDSGRDRDGGGGRDGSGYRSSGSGGGGGRMGSSSSSSSRGSRYRNGRDSRDRDGGSRDLRDSDRGSGSRSDRGGSGSRHRSSGGSNGGTRGGDGGYDDYPDGERTTNQVTIPKEYAGAIIGKGGSRIRRIRADSGASITIDEALPGATDRIITISGAPGQIRMAQYLLQQSVKDHGELKEH